MSWKRITPDDILPHHRFWTKNPGFLSASQYTLAVIVVPHSIKSTKKTPFSSQKTVTLIFQLVYGVCLNYFWFWWSWVASLQWLLFCFWIYGRYPHLINDSNVEKHILSILSVTIQKLLSTKHFLLFVLVSEHFWYSPCTQFVVSKFFHGNCVDSSAFKVGKFIS